MATGTRLTKLDRDLDAMLVELATNEDRADLLCCCLAYTRPPWGLGWLAGGALLLELSALPKSHTNNTLRACLLVRRSDGMVEQRPVTDVVLDSIAIVPSASLTRGRRGLILTRAQWGSLRGWIPTRALESWSRVAQ